LALLMLDKNEKTRGAKNAGKTGRSPNLVAGGEWRADSTHNQLIAVTNSGQKPVETLLSLHYANGEKIYEMQQTIAPGDQMWVNLASLIRDRVPDRKGNLLPADLASGTYDVQQINSDPRGLSLGSLAVDQTWGYQIAPPYGICCSDEDPSWDPDGFDLFLTEPGQASLEAVDSCNGTVLDLSPSIFTWASDNTSVAIVTEQHVEAVGVGTTTGTATGDISVGVGGYCPLRTVQLNVPITVQPPQIISIVPSTGQAGGSSQVAVSGSGFGPGSAINISPAGIQVSAVTVSTDGTLINAVFTIPAGTVPGAYTVSVSVPNGDGGSVSSNGVTFTVTACASVTNFTRQSWVAKPATGELDITYTWSSSTGKQSDLAACQLAEYVTYPGAPGTYTWPRPPFGQATANPTPGGGSAANSVYIDQHLPPVSWIKPYIAASFTANQTYQYVCPCVNGGSQVQLGQYTITRSVTQNSDGSYMYTVTKSSGESATLNPLP
jgi:hypothetical protein